MTKQINMVKALVSNMIDKYGYKKNLIEVRSDGRIIVDGEYNKIITNRYMKTANELIDRGYHTRPVGKRYVIYNIEGKRKDLVIGN